MNILFANYGDCTTNSLNHIGAFANQLTRLGHACVVAIPEKPETVTALIDPLYPVHTFDRVLTEGAGFPNRAPADVVHKEREQLDAMKAQLSAIEASLQEL